MKLILSKKSNTAIALGEQLGVPVVKELPENQEIKRIVRWGSTKHFAGRQLNTAKGVSNASDKQLCRKLLRDAGLPVPDETETDFPLVGRPAKHSGGRHFYYCKSLVGLRRAKRRGAVYFSKYYPKQNEYRVHVGSGKVLFMSIKEGDKTKKIWNAHKNGFTFRHMGRSEWLDNEHLRNMARASKKALKVLGLDYGAVDILADADRIGKYRPFLICEVNTAPHLSDLALSKYVEYFKAKLRL